RYRSARPDPRAEIGGRRREETHAQDRNRCEESCDGVRRVEAVLDVGEKRTDTDDLRAQRECDEEEPGQCGGRTHARILSSLTGVAGYSTAFPRPERIFDSCRGHLLRRPPGDQDGYDGVVCRAIEFELAAVGVDDGLRDAQSEARMVGAAVETDEPSKRL